MSLTITLPEPLATRLQTHSRQMQKPVAEVATDLLEQALSPHASASTNETVETPEQIVARIKALPRNPQNILNAETLRGNRAALASYLTKSIAAENRNEPFDEQEWNRQWDAIEAAIKATDRAKRLERERWFAEEMQ